MPVSPHRIEKYLSRHIGALIHIKDRAIAIVSTDRGGIDVDQRRAAHLAYKLRSRLSAELRQEMHACWRSANAAFFDHVGFARRMDIHDYDDRRRLRKTELGVEA
jgi:hypothetical protein